MIFWTLFDEVTGAVVTTGTAMTVEQAQAQATPGRRVAYEEILDPTPPPPSLPGVPPAPAPGPAPAPAPTPAPTPAPQLPGNNTHVVTNPGGASPTVTTRAATTVTHDKTTISSSGSDMITFGSIQAGAQATITPPDNVGIAPIPALTINDGVLQITTTVPGAYKVVITDFPRLDKQVTFNAI